MRSYTEATTLRNVLQRIADGVDDRITVEVEQKGREWGFRMHDPWGGNWFEENWRKVRNHFWSGY